MPDCTRRSPCPSGGRIDFLAERSMFTREFGRPHQACRFNLERHRERRQLCAAKQAGAESAIRNRPNKSKQVASPSNVCSQARVAGDDALSWSCGDLQAGAADDKSSLVVVLCVSEANTACRPERSQLRRRRSTASNLPH